jgi:hypothetical protein
MSLQDLGSLGDFASGVGTIVLTGAALWGGGAALQDVRARLKQQRELSAEQREQIRLDRRRVLNGWSRGGTHVYGVQLVSQPEELNNAVKELVAGEPSDYVVIRVNETAFGNANRAYSLRQLVESTGFLAEAPSAGEYEALEAGRKVLDLPMPDYSPGA